MKQLPSVTSIRTTRSYDALLASLYARTKSQAEEIVVPPIRVISVQGNQPPALTGEYSNAIAVLYGIAYALKMGLKFRKLPRPKGYFDYKVGALETFWWSTGRTLEIANPKTLRWQAYLMVPAFIGKKLFDEARKQAKAKHPEIPYELASLETIREGRSVQMLHVGPYDKEGPTIDKLHTYMADHGLALNGKHHEIYLSDPRRTTPEKLRTVIRLAAKSARARTAARALTMVAATTLMGFSQLEAQNFSLDLRAAPAVATQRYEGALLDGGLMFGATIEYKVRKHVYVYGGWDWTHFHAQDSFAGPDRDIEETGYILGLRLEYRMPIEPDISISVLGGVTYKHMEIEDDDGNTIADSGHKPGFEAGTGLRIPLAAKWWLLPTVRFRVLSADVKVANVTTRADLHYVALEMGLSRVF